MAARVTGVFWVIICLILLAGYMYEGYQRNGLLLQPNWLSVLLIIFLIDGLCGLVIALWHEALGIVISFSGFSLFILLLIVDPKLTFNPFALLLFLPTLLYFVHWRDARKKNPD